MTPERAAFIQPERALPQLSCRELAHAVSLLIAKNLERISCKDDRKCSPLPFVSLEQRAPEYLDRRDPMSRKAMQPYDSCWRAQREEDHGRHSAHLLLRGKHPRIAWISSVDAPLRKLL